MINKIHADGLWLSAGFGKLAQLSALVFLLSSTITTIASSADEGVGNTTSKQLSWKPGPPTSLSGKGYGFDFEALTSSAANTINSASTIYDASSFCLPGDLSDVLSDAHARNRVPSCKKTCLPRPQNMNSEDASYYEDEWDISWCRSCVPINTYLPIEEILKIEKAGNMRLCPRPETLVRLSRERRGEVIQSAGHGLRSTIRSAGSVMRRHDNIAVLIGNAAYRSGLPRKATAFGDLAAFHTLLSEQLGYRAQNIIEVRNANQAKLIELFGRRQAPHGALAKRLKRRPGASLLIYYSGYGAISERDEMAYLLPIDATRRYSSDNALQLETFYENIVNIGAAHVTVILEADFHRDPGAMVLAPNPPLHKESILPEEPSPGLSVMTAAQGDQHALGDPQYGSGLFTRYLIEALSGQADAAPLGNYDGAIDSAEAFVYAALMTRRAAAKAFGIMQHPKYSSQRPAVITAHTALDEIATPKAVDE